MGGYIIRWDVDGICRQLDQCSAEMNSRYNDGYTAWQCKKSLLEINERLEDLLRSSPNFGHLEEEFLKEQAQRRAWKILNEK